MSSSKFANLEGVDFESPDIYETHSPSPTRKTRNLKKSYRGRASDSSSEDSDDDDFDERDHGARSVRKGAKKVGGQEGHVGSSNPEIVGAALDPEEASRKFQQATNLDSRNVDFSSAIHKRKKRPQYYPPATFETTTYELGSGTGYRTSGERPVDKFRRLRFEMEELEKELKEGSSSRGIEGEKTGKEEEASSGLMQQLLALRGNLTILEDQEVHTDASSSSVSSSWERETRRLLEKLSVQGGGAAVEVAKEGEAKEVLRRSAGGDASMVAAWDRRLSGLEDLIGVKDAMSDETKALPRPLLPALARIEHLLTLLTHPRHLDGISRRIKVLVSELERLHEARRKLNINQTITNGDAAAAAAAAAAAGTSSSQSFIPFETMQKLETVLPMMSKMEPLLPVVPALLARLHSLAALHSSSNSFVENMNQMEASIKRSQTNDDELKVMLSNLESSFSENQKRVESNLQLVEERMENILQRVSNLQRG
ncbi:hypothetical protein CBS101457_000332 [Exobasidium rhododendri]|nr:hypothetical protein CBS101457_000332 [Exobasidium rhododendri]